MAEKKKTYPTIPIKHWWTLRSKFKTRIPVAVTPGYIASALSMTERSAKANVLPALIAFGIVDQDGKPKDRAVKWRDDDQYPEVCGEIQQEIYPEELMDALPGPDLDISTVIRWFMAKTGVGSPAARKMALVYQLLTEGDPTRAEEDIAKGMAQTRKLKGKPKPAVTPADHSPVQALVEESPDTVSSTAVLPIPQDFSPSIHIDIQVHISPEASGDQIDEIFASMARHLFRRA